MDNKMNPKAQEELGEILENLAVGLFNCNYNPSVRKKPINQAISAILSAGYVKLNKVEALDYVVKEIRSLSYIKLSDVEIDRGKLLRLLETRFEQRFGCWEGDKSVLDKISDVIATHSQQILKVGER